MDKDWLERELAEGRSIESIAREVGRDSTTVAYWVRKHGLVSQHAERHAARGGLSVGDLKPLVDRHMTVRDIASHFDCGYGTVRYWLRAHGLETTAAARRSIAVSDRPGRIEGTCRKHGEVELVLRSEGGYRCVRCRAEQVAAWRRRVKVRLVSEAGGRCKLCGYDRCVAALEFHHLDPSEKRFALGSRGLGRSLADLRAEARKCVLLCSNCHAEVEAGYAVVEAESS